MIIIINFKAYPQGIGPNAVRLAKICNRVAKKHNANIAVAVQPADILPVASIVNIPVLAQHVDAIKPGAHTGSVMPESVAASGAVGTLINHSEKKLSLPVIDETIKRCKKVGLVSVVCAGSPAEESKILKFKPDLIAIEPPALIGGKVSVSKAKPHLIEKSVKRAGRTPILCGAGVHTTQDVRKALELGAQGVLVASGVVKAKNPEKALVELIKGTKN